jgi:hypothetical protein
VIETLNAQNGSAVLRDDGLWLASAFNPEAEAREWLARRREFLSQVKCIFVLGAGAGYHVSELYRHCDAEILVIETRAERIAAVSAIHAFDSHRVKFICVDNVKRLRADERVRSAVSSSFVILQHAPSLAAQNELYRELHAQLLGRDWGALSWQWQMKGFAALDSRPQIQRGGEPLTILDLEQTELARDSEERERMLIKALRELVK